MMTEKEINALRLPWRRAVEDYRRVHPDAPIYDMKKDRNRNLQFFLECVACKTPRWVQINNFKTSYKNGTWTGLCNSCCGSSMGANPEATKKGTAKRTKPFEKAAEEVKTASDGCLILLTYVNSYANADILCNNCGSEFSRSPHSIIYHNVTNCPHCDARGYSLPTCLYLYRFEPQWYPPFLKIGVTYSLKTRSQFWRGVRYLLADYHDEPAIIRKHERILLGMHMPYNGPTWSSLNGVGVTEARAIEYQEEYVAYFEKLERS